MKAFKKSLSFLLAVMFILGSLGVAASASQSTDYTITLPTYGEYVCENNVEYGIFQFNAVVPSEFFNVPASWTWSLTKAVPLTAHPEYTDGKALESYPEATAIDSDGTAYYSCSTPDTPIEYPGGSVIVAQNRYTVPLYPGQYFVSFAYKNASTTRIIPATFFNLSLPASKEARESLNSVINKGIETFNRSHLYDTESAEWINFAKVLGEAKTVISAYEAGMDDLNNKRVELEDAINSLTIVNESAKGSFASFFSMIAEIFQNIMNINRDKTLVEILGELKNAILGGLFG